MEKFCCQICSTLFTTVCDFKNHITSSVHKQNFKKVYPDEFFRRHFYTPWIFYKDHDYKITQHILGLSQMTLCFSPEVKNGFYLCHVCEKKCLIKFVVHHVSHGDHIKNYFAYTDPNALDFAWKNNYLKKELKKTGLGVLQVLHLPANIQKQCDAKTYCQVMILLHQNKLLSVMFKELKPDRTSIQTYRDDANRKHPLLGLQHIVECVCVSQYEMKHYLCTLCCLNVPSSMIIGHLLSLDHLFCYFNKWHPSTLTARESYKNSETDSMLTDLAKQSEKIHGLADIQQVKLELCQFFTVQKASFKDALSTIESINKSILLPTVKPGKKLEPTSSESDEVPSKVNAEPCTSGSSIFLPSAGEPSASSAAQLYSLLCQNCHRKFETDTLYFNHLSMSRHQETFRKNFGQAFQCKPHLPLYNDFTKHDLSCVGVSLVMTIFSHQVSHEPVHVCLACEVVFLSGSLKQHMNSLRHIVQTLMYQNPWRLPFGWKMRLDQKYMKLQACKEEDERGPDQQIIRILDVPSNLLPSGAPLIFSKVMEKLNRLMSGVPQRQTFSKLQGNDKFPLLGKEFLVKYGEAANGWKFLCLLCQRTLSADDYAGHVFSWDHVATFLNKYHPGSLDLNTTTEEILLDLAKQAAHIHCVSDEQIIEFNQRICEVSDYATKVRLLSAEKERGGKGTLMPCITPKMKLVLRQRQTQEKDWNTEATNESNVVENIKSNSKMPSEKAVDSVQSADQVLWIKNDEKVETMEISLQEKVEEVSTMKRPLSDMDTSDMEAEDVDPKRLRPSSSEKREEMPNLPNMDATGQSSSRDTAAVGSVSHYECVLWSYIKKKAREPLIGLSAVYECVCDNHAPIYLCECCHLIIKEQYIVRHLTAAEHYYNYLAMAGEHPLPQDQKWRKEVSKLAAYWERSKGYGEAQVVELNSEEFSKLASSVYQKAIKIVKNLAMQENKKNITCVDTTTANSQEPPQQDGKIEIHPEHTPSKTSLSSKTETNTKLKQDIIILRPQGPENSATAAATLSPDNEDTSLEMGAKTHTVAPKLDKLESVMSASPTTIDTSNPNPKPVCKFITRKSANQNMLIPTMTHLKPYDTDDVSPNTQTIASLIVKDSTKVTNCLPISDSAKESPELQGVFTIQESILSDAVHKCEADSMASEPVFKVALSGNNPTTSKSFQTKLPSTATAKSTPKTLEGHTKSTVNQLKLNINATSIQNDSPFDCPLKKILFTPTTPNCDLQTQTTEASEKATTANCPKVGLDQLLRVTCKDSTRTCCFACSMILEKSNHLTSMTHQINCVKARYPSWSGKPNETKLSDMVAQLAEYEKAQKLRCKQIEVSLDVYKELKSLPKDKAIEKVKGMIKKKSSMKSAQLQSAATSDVSSPCDIRFSPSVSVSPCDVMSPDLGKENSQTEQQAKSIAEPIKKLPVSSPSPTVQKPTSKVAPRIIKGSTTDDLSTLSHILKVIDRTVIGLSFVWECRVVPPKLPTFYLCESCHLTISVNEICEHMTSAEHRLKYLMREYPRFMYWIEEDLLPEMMDELTNDIAGWILCREEFMDAQTVLLSVECSEWVRTAPFAEALNVVHRIKQQKKITTLPIIVTSQHNLENQMEMSISEDSRTTDLDNTSHGIDGNLTEKCPSPAEPNNMASPSITELHFSPVQNPASVCRNVFNQNMLASPKDENQELFEPANEAVPNNPTALSQLVSETFTKLLVSQPPSTNLPEQPECITSSSCSVNQNMSTSKNENKEHCEPETKYMSSPLSHDSAVGSPIGTGTTSLTTPKNAKHETDIQEHMALESAPQYSSGSTGDPTSLVAAFATNRNNTKSPELDFNIQNEVDMFQLLINLIKQNKPVANLEVSAESSESNVEKCKAPRSTRWDVGPPSDTDTDVSLKEDTILNEDMMGTLKLPSHGDSLANGSGACKTTSSSEMTVIQKWQGQVQSQDKLEERRVKTEDIEMHEVKKNEASEHKVSVQISQQKVQGPNKEKQPNFNIGAEQSKIQQSQVQTWLPQDQVQHEPSNTEAIQIQQTHFQVQQSQVLQLQRPTQMDHQNIPQSRVSSCPFTPLSLADHKTLYVSRDSDYRQTISVMNANVQVSQGPLSTAAAATVSSCPSNTMLATGGYSHFVQTCYPANLYSHSNIPAQTFYYSPRFAYPNQVYHLQQTQYYTSMEPFTQNVQSPGALRSFSPNAPPQSGAQTYAVWSNGAVAGSSNVAYSNAVPYNTAHHQSCINNYNNVQEYNRELQNHFHTQSSFPGSENSHFPNRQ